MLPKILSNNVCSLNPFEDKLTLSCIMLLDNNGRVVKSKIQESVCGKTTDAKRRTAFSNAFPLD